MKFEEFNVLERKVDNIEKSLEQISKIDLSNHMLLEKLSTALDSIAASLKLIAEAYNTPYDTEDEEEEEEEFVGLTD